MIDVRQQTPGPSDSTSSDVELPISVAVVNDYEIVVAGVAGMLARFPDRIDVCEQIVIGEPIDHPPIDVALYDTYGRGGIAPQALDRLRRHRHILNVAMFSLELVPGLVDEARQHGASGFIAKTLPAEAIVDALLRTAAGEEAMADGRSSRPALDELDWPGKDRGLTERESQVLVLAAEGLTNNEIGAALYVGRETVKSHLSRAYKQLGVRNRTQAASYVHDTGAFERFRPTEDALEEA